MASAAPAAGCCGAGTGAWARAGEPGTTCTIKAARPKTKGARRMAALLRCNPPQVQLFPPPDKSKCCDVCDEIGAGGLRNLVTHAPIRFSLDVMQFTRLAFHVQPG